MTIIWCMVPEIWNVTDRFFVILDRFLPFYPIKTWKIKILKNEKKGPGDIFILHKCSKNHDHIPEISWDMARKGCKCYFSFWTIFCLFTSATACKIIILEKWTKILEMSSFYNSVPKVMIICYTVPDIWHVMDVIIFHFGLFFALLPC